MNHRLAATILGLSVLVRAGAADLAGVTVGFIGSPGTARVSAELTGRFQLRLQVDPLGTAQPLSLQVHLPETGPRAWPAADVEVRDARGQALAVERSGIEWAKLRIPVQAEAATYWVQAVPPPQPAPPTFPDKDRQLRDDATGLSVRVTPWHLGRQAALSFRFDDSHPTHLSKAVPILREYGFRGTFMINPGQPEPGSRWRSAFLDQLAEWEAVARQGDHEFANHSARHRGAASDTEMESEIGEAAQMIARLTPGRSPLSALNLGGGTRWTTTRTLRHYLDKHHHFDASGSSTGMDDSYGNRVENFRRLLEQHLQRGLWLRTHYHYIGDGLSTSEANFRAVLDLARQHQDRLWIAGMADIHKYLTERNSARLTRLDAPAGSLGFRLDCGTDPRLYDQPLTLEAACPPGETWELRGPDGAAIPALADSRPPLLRFAVPARSGAFRLARRS